MGASLPRGTAQRAQTNNSILARRATKQDRVCSPLVEALKAAAGAEYEGVLETRLEALRIPFATEADLRAGGFARTPVRLYACAKG